MFHFDGGSLLEYIKPWLTYDQQADLLASRGMLFDRAELVAHLESVGYYRLSGYWHIFRLEPEGPDESFAPGTDFSRIWDLYSFDRNLRLSALDAVERVEVCLRSKLAYELAEASGPFGFLERSSLPNMSQQTYGRFMSRCFSCYDRSKATFIDHFKRSYGDAHGLPPYWTLVNVLDFGGMLTLFRGSPDPVKRSIADGFDVPPEVLESWLLTLNTVRNSCCHHERLWNRRLGVRPKIPRGKKYPGWHIPYEVPNDGSFCVLTILGWMLARIAPEDPWQRRLLDLLGTRSPEDLRRMGFREGWEQCPLWRVSPRR